MSVVYIAGPMRGIPQFNFPAFDAARDFLRSKGWAVCSPADMDRAKGFDPSLHLPATWDWNTLPTGFNLAETIDRDIAALKECDAIAMLPGWQDSTGARAEYAMAQWLGKRVIDATTGEDLQLSDSHNVTKNDTLRKQEVIVTDAITGGKKGSKPEAFDMIPVEPMQELARVYSMGAAKYSRDNWRKGYAWSLSFAALMRHCWLFWRGETYDKESGLHHLAHAMFHCSALIWFTDNRKDKDDRYKELKYGKSPNRL
jgi:hypothetical protein